MAHLLRTACRQDPNIGLHGFANDKLCLLPECSKEIASILNVPCHETSLCGTSLVGVFAAGNNNGIIVPSIAFDSELAFLEKIGIPVNVLETDFTALGNLIAANDDSCLISPELEPCKSKIKKFLKVKKIQVGIISGLPTVGSMIAINNKGVYLSALATDQDEAMVAKFFGLPVTRGTVNLGVPFVRSGIIVNSHGLVIGNRTGGPEANHIDGALGFLK